MRSVKIALALAVALVLVAIGAVLSRSPLTVAGANSTAAPLYRNGLILADSSGCQSAGTVPRGTSAIRISLGANVDPKISVGLYASSRLVTEGERGADGGLNASATVAVKPLSSTVHDALLCIRLGPSAEAIGVRGLPTRPALNGLSSLQDMLLRFEYLRPGTSSWWSRASSIAYRFGLGRAASGTWVAFFVIAVMLAVAALASALALKELR
jgi:hypothetical protein